MVSDFVVYFVIFLIVVIVILDIVILVYVINQYNTYQTDKQNVNAVIADIKNAERILLDTQNIIKNCGHCNPHPNGCRCRKCCPPKHHKKCPSPCSPCTSDSSHSSSCSNSIEYCSDTCSEDNNCNPYKGGLIKPANYSH